MNKHLRPSPKKHHATARSQCVHALLKVTVDHASLSQVLPALETELTEQDRPLFRELTLGICRWYTQLDIIARQLLTRPLRKRDHTTRLLIFLGIYQLVHTRVAAHAAIHETVELAPHFNASNQRGLINAILRNCQREQPQICAELSSDPGYRFSHPQWMVDKLTANWPDHAELILSANNEKAPVTLRINRRLCSREAYVQALSSAGIAHDLCAYSDYGVRLTESVPVSQLPGYDAGWFSVQDEAAQLCTTLLNLDASGLHILDACAAPGGKTTAILEATDNTAKVTALELSEPRLARVQENLDRLSLTAQLISGDATQRDWWNGTQFDRILLDAPCSASGVIRKHPDIKLLRRETDIAALAETQLAMLTNLWSTLKSGGTLVYATCSVFNQENSRIIERFLKQTPDAAATQLDVPWGLPVPHGRQLFPGRDSHDGFFYAQLRKQKIPEKSKK